MTTRWEDQPNQAYDITVEATITRRQATITDTINYLFILDAKEQTGVLWRVAEDSDSMTRVNAGGLTLEDAPDLADQDAREQLAAAYKEEIITT